MSNEAGTSVAAEYVAHHLRLFGIANARAFGAKPPAAATDAVGVVGAATGDATPWIHAANGGATVVVLHPEWIAPRLGIAAAAASGAPPSRLTASASEPRFANLRTLHAWQRFDSSRSIPIVIDERGDPAWLWYPSGQGGLMLIGTNLAGDLMRYREGDPSRANARPAALWGFADERPVHFFDAQIAGEPRGARFADEWAALLAGEVASKARISLPPLLPGGAPGAVVISGDDDAALLGCYAEQLRLIDGFPITYFMHPNTRHTRRTVASMLSRVGIELGLHPDALHAPDRYDELLPQQVAWFRDLFEREPRAVRNHGFLSRGFWGHLPAWLANGLQVSSNLPGLDGRMLNGSLLPARVSAGGPLSPHWSILTAIGDGVLFVKEAYTRDGARAVFDLADSIRAHPVPGVMVLNLHPQNIEKARDMHRAVVDVVRSGFLAWSMADCVSWFAARDGSPLLAVSAPPAGPVRRAVRRLFANRVPSPLQA